MSWFRGTLEERLTAAVGFFDEAVGQALAKGRKLDLMILPETAIQSGRQGSAKDRAVPLEGLVLDRLGAKAREHRAYLLAGVQIC